MKFSSRAAVLVLVSHTFLSFFLGIGAVVAACSACNRKVVGSNPGSALLIPEVNVVDIHG